MFGDDLKKSLEPIKASDELLAKTRLAIEKARLEQAAQTIESKKKKQRTSIFWKVAIPIACTVLLVGGIAVILPKLSKETSKKTKSFSTSAYYRSDEAEETQSTSADTWAEDTEWTEYREETTWSETTYIPTSNTNAYKGERVDNYADLIPEKDEYKNALLIDDYILCIAEDGKSMELRDPVTNEIVPETDTYCAPQIKDLPEDRYYVNFSYDESDCTIFLIVADTLSIDDATVMDYYIAVYDHGELLAGDPFYVFSIEQ